MNDEKKLGPLIRVNWAPEEKAEDYARFWADLYPVVVKTVEASFMDGETSVRHHTDAEIKERVRVCKGLVDTMRKDLGWSRQRIKDNLALAFKAKLTGLEFDLDALSKRGTW